MFSLGCGLKITHIGAGNCYACAGASLPRTEILLSRRHFLLSLTAAPLMALTACNTAGFGPLNVAAADGVVHSYAGYRPDEPLPTPISDRPKSRPELERKTVSYDGSERPGTVVVRTTERRLYFV